MKTNTLEMGRVGGGKTRSIETLVRALRAQSETSKVGVIAMEAGIEAVLGHIPCRDGLHWHYILPLNLDWDEVTKFIRMMNTLGVGKLADVNDPNRTKYTRFLEVFSTCQSFVCDRCGESLGCVDDWDDTCALVMDGCTGLCKLAMQTLVGAKPFVSLPEYKAGQEAVMALMNMCLPLRCSFVLLAHTDREFSHETGQTLITVNAIGQKLAPQLVKAFSEVVSAKREFTNRGMQFYWDTTEAGEETKVRRLPWGDRLAPDFGPLV
jgi:hypothetical protein